MLADVVQLGSLMLHGSPSSELCIQRFISAAVEESPYDAVIDYVISMEMLLAPALGDKYRGEVRFRFALNGARYLGTTPGERRLLFGQFKTLYDTRSSLVHGSVSSKLDAVGVARLARELAAQCIVKALRTQWPTADTFESLFLDAPTE
jgi:hypothetical protein